MECTHGLSPRFCPSCEDGRPTWVYQTFGGSSYHSRTDCERLTSGRPRAHLPGLIDHPVERITRAEAEAYLYQPCPACTQSGSADLADAGGQSGTRVWAKGA